MTITGRNNFEARHPIERSRAVSRDESLQI
jgi:hypothetical protein